MIKKWQIVTASMLLSLLSFKVQANVKFIVDNKPGELVSGMKRCVLIRAIRSKRPTVRKAWWETAAPTATNMLTNV